MSDRPRERHTMKPYRAIVRLAIAAMLAAQFGGAAPAVAQEEHIIAVINDEVVSKFDLEQGVKLAMIFLGLRGTAEDVRRTVPQVLRRLIDQRLFLQEAKSRNISVSDTDIERQIARLENSDRFTDISLRRRLKDANISLETLRNQIRAELAWGELVRRRGQRPGTVSEDEIDEELERIKATRGSPEYLASEIFLVVESLDQDATVRRSARRMVEQIRSGTSFSNLARQFSNGSTAARGGDMGWVQNHQLAEEVVAVLAALEQGQVSDPIRSNGGYLVLQLRERRLYMVANPNDTKVSVRQIFLPVPEGASEEEARVNLDLAATLQSTVIDCDDMGKVGAEIDPSSAGDPITSRVGDLRPELRQIVQDLPIGSIGRPELSGPGVLLLMVCDRIESTVPLPDRAAVSRRLREAKAEPVRRRYHRDLLRAAYRDVRI